jgi:outer membrane lipoprotein-sorting protein
MNCTDYREMLAAYVEGLLDAAQTGDIENHLRNCPACREELAAIQGLLGRLATDGKSYEQTSVENTVIDRIFREQQFRLRQAENAGYQIRLRRFIMSRYGKLAIAAVLVAAMGLGFVLFQGTGKITLAGVAQKLQQITTLTYKIHMTMAGLPGLPEGRIVNMDSDAFSAVGQGMRMTGMVEGKLASVTIMNFQEKVLLTLDPESKKFTRVALSGELADKMKENNGDPRLMVDKFLKAEYTDLGRSQIDGVEVQGFESENAAVTGGLFKNSVARIWVDISTGYPFRLTIERQGTHPDTRMDITVDNFAWNVPVEPDGFSLAVPDGYTSLGDYALKGMADGQELIDAIKFFQECSGGAFPKSLSTMDLTQELMNVAKERAIQSPQEQTDRYMKLTMAAANFQILAGQKGEPRYYGETVQPGEAAKVLVRWKNPTGQYRVIYGDLRSEEVTAERLAELEAQP